MKIQVALSAVPLKTYFKYLKRKGFPLRFEKSSISRLYSDIFKAWAIKNKTYTGKPVYRLYFPLKKTENTLEMDTEIVQFVQSQGFKVEDYTKGLVTKDGRNLMKIGKVLKKKPDLLDRYVKQKSKIGMKKESEDEILIVISRHPYDFLGMSTDREWYSCTRLGVKSIHYPELDARNPERKHRSVNYEYVLRDVEEGSLIAYAIKKHDLNIQKPIARIRILRYVNPDTQEFILKRHPRVYGMNLVGLEQAVDGWLETVNVNSEGEDYYCVRDQADTHNLLEIGNKQKRYDVNDIISMIDTPYEWIREMYENEKGEMVEFDDGMGAVFDDQSDLNEFVLEWIKDNPDQHENLIDDLDDAPLYDDILETIVNAHLDDPPKWFISFVNENLSEIYNADPHVLPDLIEKIPLDDRKELAQIVRRISSGRSGLALDDLKAALLQTKIKQNSYSSNIELFDFLDMVPMQRRIYADKISKLPEEKAQAAVRKRSSEFLMEAYAERRLLVISKELNERNDVPDSFYLENMEAAFSPRVLEMLLYKNKSEERFSYIHEDALLIPENKDVLLKIYKVWTEYFDRHREYYIDESSPYTKMLDVFWWNFLFKAGYGKQYYKYFFQASRDLLIKKVTSDLLKEVPAAEVLKIVENYPDLKYRQDIVIDHLKTLEE
jgi:hypothetical protein